MERVDIYAACRLCLSEGRGYANIFQVNGDRSSVISVVIGEILHCRVWSGDGYPECICPSCLDKLTEYTKFKRMCLKSKASFDNINSQASRPGKECQTETVDPDGSVSSQERGDMEEEVDEVPITIVKVEPLDSMEEEEIDIEEAVTDEVEWKESMRQGEFSAEMDYGGRFIQATICNGVSSQVIPRPNEYFNEEVIVDDIPDEEVTSPIPVRLIRTTDAALVSSGRNLVWHPLVNHYPGCPVISAPTPMMKTSRCPPQRKGKKKEIVKKTALPPRRRSLHRAAKSPVKKRKRGRPWKQVVYDFLKREPPVAAELQTQPYVEIDIAEGDSTDSAGAGDGDKTCNGEVVSSNERALDFSRDAANDAPEISQSEHRSRSRTKAQKVCCDPKSERLEAGEELGRIWIKVERVESEEGCRNALEVEQYSPGENNSPRHHNQAGETHKPVEEETPRERRLRMSRERMRVLRANLTMEQLLHRRLIAAQRAAAKRRSETPEERSRRLLLARQRRASSLRRETPEQTAKRRLLDKIRHANMRRKESENEQVLTSKLTAQGCGAVA